MVDTFTWNMVWASVRYFVGRDSILAVSFPCDIVLNIVSKLDDHQRMVLKEEIEDRIKTIALVNTPTNNVSKDADSSLKEWKKLIAYLDTDNRYNLYGSDTEVFECFKYNDQYVPIHIYLTNPLVSVHMNEENIVNTVKIEN